MTNGKITNVIVGELMRNLIVQQFTTVDNIAAELDGGMSFVTGKPFAQSNEENFKTEAMAFLDRIDTMILGRKTYEMFSNYWPTAQDTEGKFADRINGLTKYIASTTLDSAPWGEYSDATITKDPIKTIKELKSGDGKDIVVWGSLSLTRDLFAAKLVDEVQLRICPVTRGAGTRAFDASMNLTLIDITTYERGVVVAKYHVD